MTQSLQVPENSGQQDATPVEKTHPMFSTDSFLVDRLALSIVVRCRCRYRRFVAMLLCTCA